jgi:hypothetical protein
VICGSTPRPNPTTNGEDSQPAKLPSAADLMNNNNSNRLEPWPNGWGFLLGKHKPALVASGAETVQDRTSGNFRFWGTVEMLWIVAAGGILGAFALGFFAGINTIDGHDDASIPSSRNF